LLTLNHRRPPVSKEGENTADDRQLFRILRRGGYIDTHFDYDAFTDFVYRALEKDLPRSFPFEPLLRDIEMLMAQLGVMPFDESSLPPEDPRTF